MNTARSQRFEGFVAHLQINKSCDRLLIVKAPIKQQYKPYGTHYVKRRVGVALVSSLGMANNGFPHISKI